MSKCLMGASDPMSKLTHLCQNALLHIVATVHFLPWTVKLWHWKSLFTYNTGILTLNGVLWTLTFVPNSTVALWPWMVHLQPIDVLTHKQVCFHPEWCGIHPQMHSQHKTQTCVCKTVWNDPLFRLIKALFMERGTGNVKSKQSKQ